MQTEQSKESVDTGRTEAEAQKEEGKAKGEMVKRRAKGTIDWGPIRKEWMKGCDVAEMASRHGTSPKTIYSQAARRKWPARETVVKAAAVTSRTGEMAGEVVKRSIETSVAEQAPAIAAAVREQLNGWFTKVLRTTDKLQSHVDAMADGRLEVEEVKSLASSLEVVDRVARRTFGLDSPAGSAVSVFSVAAPVVSCPVIDVEPISEATPASAT